MTAKQHSTGLVLALWALVSTVGACPVGVSQETCRRDLDCPANFHCLAGTCSRLVVDAASVDGATLDSSRTDRLPVDTGFADHAASDLTTLDGTQNDGQGMDATLRDSSPPDLGGLDSPAPDTACSDGGAADGAVADTAVSDASAADLHPPQDGPLPLDASPPVDVGRPDLATAADSSGGGDSSCSGHAGELCARPGFCGARFDCSGTCVGGFTADPCPQCGTRTCESLLNWSECLGGTCGAHSACNPSTGSCLCTVAECAGSYCCSGDLCGCDVDAYGCGARTGVVENCPSKLCSGNPPACETPPCDVNCGGCCDNTGSCQPGYADSACGTGGSPCQNCQLQDNPCVDWDCSNDDCNIYSFSVNGSSCGDNNECWSTECVTCDARHDEICWLPCTCQIGTTATTGTYDCFGVCQEDPGCTCAQQCAGTC
ncbi:MAG: hypothetical protein ABIJ09_05240 [Pseudomonadota bacterium]